MVGVPKIAHREQRTRGTVIRGKSGNRLCLLNKFKQLSFANCSRFETCLKLHILCMLEGFLQASHIQLNNDIEACIEVRSKLINPF